MTETEEQFVRQWNKFEEDKCICNEGIHNGNEVDCACKCHNKNE